MRYPRGKLLPTMLYAAKCYWPGIDTSEFSREPAARLLRTEARCGYVGSLLFAADELVLCMFDAPAPATVLTATRAALIPVDRIMQATWFPVGSPTAPRE